MRTLAMGMTVLLLAVPASAATTGLHGVVQRGPLTPVCHAELRCSAPAKDIKLTFTRAGSSWTTKTDQQGHYTISLKPGTYDVRIASGRFGNQPRAAQVPIGRIGIRNFTIDTGIR